MKKPVFRIICFTIIVFLAACKSPNEMDKIVTFSGISLIEVTESTAKLSAQISSDGGGISEKGFCWSDSKTPTVADNIKKIMAPGTTMETLIEGLTTNTKYFVRAFAINDAGIAYSEVLELTTTASDVVLGITNVENITFESAVFSSTISHRANIVVTEKGFCFGMNPEPTVSDFKIEVSESDFTITATNLLSNSLYNVRAYAIVSGNPVYGEINTFKTLLSDSDILQYFVPPTYADDYSSISGWHQRHLWNLANIHDPTVEKQGEYFYMYGTDASFGDVHKGYGHYPYRRSKDLVNWEFMGMAMPNDPPTWVKDSLNNMRVRQGLTPIANPVFGYWAPVVRKVGTKYRMYYSMIVDHYIATGKRANAENFDGSWTERAFIGLMETEDLATNNWEDKGMVVCSSTDRGKNWTRASLNDWNGYFKWNAIDPSFIITPQGEHYLIYGSWHSGLVSLKLNPATGKPDKLGNPWEYSALANYGTRVYTRNTSRWQASEAPEIIYNSETGYYYLFIAYDELSVAYNTRVLRSRNINGPYSDYSGRSAANPLENVMPIITHPYQFNNHSGWVGISHNCIFEDGDGNWYYSSQGRLPANTGGNKSSNHIMMGHVRKVRWTDNGWPVVMPERYAGVPDVPIREAEMVGAWEMITLNYNFGRMQTSQRLVLNGNKTASGALNGSWSWDQTNKVLTIGTQKLYVEREVDWEANPRVHTVVFAGLNTSGVSLWGKKIRN
ncbi:MAG: family 43 glycosylhydrolase [Porphyromonadaceae bacterium]|jgi:arabinan endo-1,5-alpha-L-arabinosidase|nr:family 43 glycosylhydrolase [Porphyromonadaceae bacterium]